jgi:hypothetical protein
MIVFPVNTLLIVSITPQPSGLQKATLQAIISGRVVLETVIHPDGCRGHDRLVDVGHAKHLR